MYYSTVRPLSIDIILPNALEMNRSRPLMVVAEQSVEVKCRTFGSRPAPSITWWKGNKQIPSQLSAISVFIIHPIFLIFILITMDFNRTLMTGT